MASRRLNVHLSIRAGDHTWIGTHTRVLAGVAIEDEMMIDSGSLVTNDVPSSVASYGRHTVSTRSLHEDHTA